MSRLKSLAREGLSTLLIVAVVYAASHLLIQNVQIRGYSMLPTLQDGEYVLVDTLSYRLHAPNRGDIIIFHPPVAPSQNYVKRVIGLPGDRVEVRHGTVYIDGTALSEPYIHMPDTYSWGPRVVPRGDLFVLGDNRDESYDSHLWTNSQGRPLPFLSEKEIIGRAMLAYWPFSDLHLFNAPAFAGHK